ncbi:hypothetical protein GALL_459230 [mine drainage metagenome]|uniref:Uncharacterized protein n=1 Tax=mine drainage metagenome TaxID=410659 RepID=A0A1J5PXZ2_9ZZZZ
MTKGQINRPQRALAQRTAVRQHHRESSIVADRANVAEVVCQTLQLCHHCPQRCGAGRHRGVQRRLDRAGKAPLVGNGAIARNPPGDLRAPFQRRA